MARSAPHRVIEKKIEETRRSGAEELDLSGMNLSAWPELLGQLSHLRSLNVSDNHLKSVPSSLGQLTRLQSLNLANNQLTELPESLAQLSQLQSLNLSDIGLKTFPGSLTQFRRLTWLDLSHNKITTLPAQLGQFVNLQTLKLSNNQIVELPVSIGQLIQLESLDIGNNQLTTLPKSFGQLTKLKSLDIANNQITTASDFAWDFLHLTELHLWGNPLASLPAKLAELPLVNFSINSDVLTELPPEIFQLKNLRWLDASGFETLSELHESIGQLGELRRLDVTHSKIRKIPDTIGQLSHLEELILHENSLTDLPTSIEKLHHLETVELSGNPLNPELAAAHEKGVEAVKRYLRELAKGGRNRYEAKLLILGDGNEGKTCVSRALRGLAFRTQKTTRGVDVVQWRFPHPDYAVDSEKEITLNIWDFEGQEITHQTHQFFLTSQSLYLLVFKCRDQFLIDRAEYWLDTIRSRAPQAKVAIVISQCEERSPHIPLDRIQTQYRDMLAKEWFFPVGCENGKNIEKLQAFLHRSAADLEFMGSPWPKSYEKTEEKIKAKAKTNTSHITRAKLHTFLRNAGVSKDNYEDAAGSMARIGAITQFPDCPDLRDFVVLKPQWLTKAISKVMEDGQLSDDKGEIELTRMESIWNKARYSGMLATFHDCMKEFELCYDLEDHRDSCLVPLRFGYVAPPIRWTDAPGLRERRIEYKLNVRPPMGIMSRFIVKTHHMIVRTPDHPKGIYWHNGVFLRTNSPCPSEALCEFIPDERVFRVRVRAPFPQNMSEQIHGYIQAIFSFFGGLSAERSYGCIKVDHETGAESQCKGLHTEKRIYTAISKQREMLDCEFEEHEVDPRLLVSGISSFGGFVEERLAAIVRHEMDKPPEWAQPYLHGAGKLLEWAEDNRSKLDQLLHGQATLAQEFKQEAELKLHEYLACISQMLDDRDHTAAPGLISIITKDRSPWNPAGYFKRTYTLTPFCECEGNIHACGDGCVEFTRDREWWKTTAPWIARATKVLAAGLQLGFAGMPLAVSSDVAETIEDEVKFMEALTEHLELEAPEEKKDASASAPLGDARTALPLNEPEAAITRAALARFLEETAPNNYHARKWGSLGRVRMSDNSYRWLCTECAKKKR